jgi:hypothetical protein
VGAALRISRVGDRQSIGLHHIAFKIGDDMSELPLDL